MRSGWLFVSCAALTTFAVSQVTVRSTGAEPLADRIASASRSGHWVAYGLRCVMEPRSFVSSAWKRSTSGHDDRTMDDRLADAGDPDAVRSTGVEPTPREDVRIAKRLAVIVRFERGTPVDLEFQTTDLPFDTARGPLTWIGSASAAQSANWLAAIVDGGSSPEVRRRAVRLMGWHEEALELASSHLQRWLSETGDIEVRRRAAESLGSLASENNVAVLSHCIRSDRSASVVKSCVWALGAQDAVSATDSLLSLLADPTLQTARSQIVQAVAQRASSRILPALTSLVEGDPDPEVRRMAVFGLSQLKDGRGVKPLIQLAEGSPNPVVRRAAIQALAQTGSQEAEDALIRIVRSSTRR